MKKNNTVFDSKEEAIEFMKGIKNLSQHGSKAVWSPKGTYHLKHGEYSQPDYMPAKYKDGWGIKKVHYFYPGTLRAPKDGRVRAIGHGDDVDFELVDSPY